MVNWKSLDNYERLLAAVVAASDNKVDYKRVAHFFGQGATYDAIEGRFRKAKKDALALAAEAAGRPEPKTRNDKPSTPRKKAANGDNVMTGRVTKSAQKSSNKARDTPLKSSNGSYGAAQDDSDHMSGTEFKSKLKTKIKAEESEEMGESECE